MRNKVFVGGLAGGVALFVWTVVSWMVLPLHQSSVRALPDEDRVMKALEDSGTTRGLYLVPGYPTNESASVEDRARAEKEWEEKASRGPLALVVFDPEGRPPTRMFRPLVQALAICVVAGLFSAFALSRVRIAGFAGRAGFVLCFGVFAWMLGPATEWIWFHYPADYVLASLADVLLGWTIVGAVQAGILKG